MVEEPTGEHERHGAPDAPILPRWVLWLMLPGIVAPVLVFVFIVFTQRAHDPERCRYHDVTRRDLAPSVMVVEQARNCVGAIEEHRYVLSRAGHTRVLGERTFDKHEFDAANYTWDATIDAEGEVHVEVRNAGHGQIRFREGTAEERKRDGR